MKEVFGKYGNCKIDLKKKYAFIDYDDYKGAEKAIEKLHGTNLDGYNSHFKCNIEWSNKKEKPLHIKQILGPEPEEVKTGD